MKKMFRNLMLVAVAAMSFASCQNGSIQEIARPQEVIMTIIAEADDTRTVIDEVNKVVNWSEGDQLKVIENSATYRTTTAINISADGKAKFTVKFPENTEATSFTYNAIYPASAVAEDDADKIDASKVKVIVNDTQMPTATSFDPKADILVSKHIETEAQPTELNMQFKRLVALGKMTLNNLPAANTISKVIFTANGENAKALAGRNYVNTTTGMVSEYGYYGKTNTLTMNYNEPIATRDIYFTCNPSELVAGETFIVKVVCNDATYTREVTIPTGRSLTFVEGDLNTFTVDMTNATKESNFVFAEGDYAVLAVKNGKYYALICDADGTRLDAIQEYKYDGSGTIMLTDETAKMRWTIANTENGYTFKGVNGGYIAWESDNTAKTQAEPYYLDIIEDDENAGRYNVVSKVDSTRKLQHNSDVSKYTYFAFYTSKQLGSLLLVPVVDNTAPYFTVNPTEYTFSASPSEAEFKIEGVNGFDAEVTATTDASWLSISKDEDYIFYVEPEMNKGAARSTTITFSAEGCNSVVVTINQEGDENPSTGDITPISSVLALGHNSTINAVIEGMVVSNYELNNLTSKKGIYVQDETGALQLYLAANHEIAFGTKVQVDLNGTTLGAYNGAVQVSGLALDKITTISTGNTVTPKTVTIADFLANKYEGQYIAIEGVQVAASDLSKTWVMGGSHTSINMEDANGNKFVVFSSKYATYGTQTVAQGAGTIKGISSINNGNLQIIFAQNSDYAGLTGARLDGSVAPEPEPSEVVKATVAEFLAAAEDNTIYELTGVIDRMYNNSDSDTLWGNFYLKDNTGEVLIYGLCSPEGEQKYWAASGAEVGDTITIQTVRTSHNGAAQGKNAIFVSLTPAEDGDEGGNDGENDNTGDSTESSVTLTFDDKSKRTDFTNDKQVWKENGITVTNNKSASTNNVADYCKPARFYASSNLVVEAPGNIKSIVFDCNSSSYATALKNSIGTTATTSVSSDKVTVTLDGTSDTFTISKFTAQVRMDALTVTYETWGNDTGGEVTPPTPDPTPGTGDDTTEGGNASESWLELPAVRTDNAYPNAAEYKISYNGERNYTHYYDKSTYTSMWVAYPLESKHMGSGRSDDWDYNPNIDKKYQVNLCSRSYNNNYSRGHLIPNASRNGISGMQSQTFYVTNSVPQIQDNFNGGIWVNLENALQSIGKREKIYIVTGVAFNKVGENKTIKYTTAKDDTKSIPVPNYFYKVVLKVNTNSSGVVTSASTIGFWFEHKTYSDSYTNYAVTVDQIEAWTGFDFFTNLPDSVETTAEKNSSWSTFQNW